jgi:hypothetical protein
MGDGGVLGDDDAFYKNDKATEVRAARLGIEVQARDDFADSTVDLKDAYIEYRGLAPSRPEHPACDRS